MPSAQNLVVMAHNMSLAVPCERVIEITQNTRATLTQLPAMKPPLAGTIIHRGRAVAVFDLRSILGHPTHGDEIERLRDILAQRERDHVAWLNELRECCETGSAFTKATDPNKCAFGKWYNELTATEESLDELCAGDRALRFIVASCDAPHRAIHSIASRALALASNGQLEEACGLIDAAWNNELATLKSLFRQLIEGVEANRKALYVVVDNGDEHLTFIVDHVHRIIDIDSDDVQPMNLGAVPLKGVYASPDLGEIMVLDLDGVIAGLISETPALEDLAAA